MNWLQRIFNSFVTDKPEQVKESQAKIIASMQSVGRAVVTPRNYENFSKEGYEKNVMVYQAVNKIALACSSIEWSLFSSTDNGKKFDEVLQHPLLDLIKNPNPMQGWASFIESVVGFYCISGNTYIQSTRLTESGPPLELYPLRPDRMKIIPGALGFPEAYQFNVGQEKLKFPVIYKDGRLWSDILHVKTFHPSNDYYGLSPIEPAILSIDQHNEAGTWNISLLQNQARPSGVLSMDATDQNPSGTLDDEQFARLKQMMDQQYTGKNNAGRPLLLEGGLKWQQISLSPQQMDFLENKNVSARDIALAFGVPPLLLNISNDNTFANYKEARIAFYEDTVLNVIGKIRDELNSWLVPQFGDEKLFLDFNKDSIPALVEKRMMLFETVKQNKELSFNEKRELLGYDTIEGFDVFVFGSGDRVVSSDSPDFDSINSTGNAMANSQGDQQDDTSSQQDNEDTDPPPDEDLPADEEEEQRSLSRSELEKKSDQELVSEIKFFRPVNSAERREAYVRHNLLVERQEKKLQADLETVFEEFADDVADLAEKTDRTLWEFAMYKLTDSYDSRLEETIAPHLRNTLTIFGEEILKQGKSVGDLDLEIKAKADNRFLFFLNQYVKNHTAELVKGLNETQKKQIKRVIKRVFKDEEEALIGNGTVEEPDPVPFDPVKEISSKVKGINRSRAKTIARTETGIASSSAALEAADAIEFDGEKEWISVQDSRVRKDPDHADHKSMNEVRVGIKDTFHVAPNAEMRGPRLDGPAEQVINCRCALTFI